MSNEISMTMNERGILTIQGIRCYEKGGVVYLNLEDVARGLVSLKRKIKTVLNTPLSDGNESKDILPNLVSPTSGGKMTTSRRTSSTACV